MKKRKRQPKPKRKKFKYAGCGFASKAERNFAVELDETGIPWLYEPDKFDWMPPAPKIKKYTPDFKIMRKDGSYFYVEFKGYLRKEDKTKMRQVKLQHPDIDIRFVFMNASKPASKYVRKDGTRLTYAEWAEQYGYQWAEMEIPDEWLNEMEG